MMMDKYRRVDRGFVRDEPGYLSNGSPAYVHVAGFGDPSPAIINAYDPQCGWCWLHAPHAENAHLVEIGRDDVR